MEQLMTQTLNDQIKAEWNVIRAWTATHQTMTAVILIGGAWMLGHWHFPI